MRFVLLIVLGLAIGVVGTSMAMNSLRRANAFPHGVMAVMGHHFGHLRQAVREGNCPSGNTQRRLASLRALSQDVRPAFSGIGDTVFGDYSDRLATSVDTALTAAPADCKALEPLLAEIGDRCSACHRDYR